MILIPLMASEPVAAVALKSPIRLLKILVLVPPAEINKPLIMVPALLPEIS